MGAEAVHSNCSLNELGNPFDHQEVQVALLANDPVIDRPQIGGARCAVGQVIPEEYQQAALHSQL